MVAAHRTRLRPRYAAHKCRLGAPGARLRGLSGQGALKVCRARAAAATRGSVTAFDALRTARLRAGGRCRGAARLRAAHAHGRRSVCPSTAVLHVVVGALCRSVGCGDGAEQPNAASAARLSRARAAVLAGVRSARRRVRASRATVHDPTRHRPHPSRSCLSTRVLRVSWRARAGFTAAPPAAGARCCAQSCLPPRAGVPTGASRRCSTPGKRCSDGCVAADHLGCVVAGGALAAARRGSRASERSASRRRRARGQPSGGVTARRWFPRTLRALLLLPRRLARRGRRGGLPAEPTAAFAAKPTPEPTAAVPPTSAAQRAG